MISQERQIRVLPRRRSEGLALAKPGSYEPAPVTEVTV